MVVGLERFRDHFRGLETSCALIGGAACDAWMARSGLPFRATKDLDIVLVIEALEPGVLRPGPGHALRCGRNPNGQC